MDLASYAKWDEYTLARDDMFAASDTAWAPWWVAQTDDKNEVGSMSSRIYWATSLTYL